MANWKVIPEFPDYAVSDDGNVKRLTPKRGTVAGRMLRLSKDAAGYAVVNLYPPAGRPTKVYVHRLVAAAFIDNPSNLPQVAHWDGDGMNAAATNLRWASQSANEADKKRHGRANYVPRGSRRFSAGDVEEIKRHIAAGASLRAVGRLYGVPHNTVATALTNGAFTGAPLEHASNQNCERAQG